MAVEIWAEPRTRTWLIWVWSAPLSEPPKTLKQLQQRALMKVSLVLTQLWSWTCASPSRPWSAGLVWTTAPPWGWKVPERWTLRSSWVPDGNARPWWPGMLPALSATWPHRNPTSSSGCGAQKQKNPIMFVTVKLSCGSCGSCGRCHSNVGVVFWWMTYLQPT